MAYYASEPLNRKEYGLDHWFARYKGRLGGLSNFGYVFVYNDQKGQLEAYLRRGFVESPPMPVCYLRPDTDDGIDGCEKPEQVQAKLTTDPTTYAYDQSFFSPVDENVFPGYPIGYVPFDQISGGDICLTDDIADMEHGAAVQALKDGCQMEAHYTLNMSKRHIRPSLVVI